MAEYADLNLEFLGAEALNEISQLKRELKCNNLPRWKMKDGQYILMSEMSKDHLNNTIKMCIRNGHNNNPILDQLKTELKSRK